MTPAVAGRPGGVIAARDAAGFRENAQFAAQVARIESLNSEAYLINDGVYGGDEPDHRRRPRQDRPAWARWYTDRLGYAITTPPRRTPSSSRPCSSP